MSRGKEIRGQTLVVEGSRSGASTIQSKLAYDAAFNLEFVGESKFGTLETDNKWYLERLFYDAAFNLIDIKTASNTFIMRINSAQIDIANVLTLTGERSTVLIGNDVTPSIDLQFNAIQPDDFVRIGDNLLQIISKEIDGDDFNLTLSPNTLTLNQSFDEVSITIESPLYKDFNKRSWTLRDLYIYN